MSKTNLLESSQSNAVNLPFNLPLPTDRYSLRIKDATFGNSKSSGNPMITLQCEIFAPEKVKARDDKEYVVAGREALYYLTLTNSAMHFTGAAMQKLGLEPSIDMENPDTEQFKNLTFSATCGGEDKPTRKSLTDAERMEGKKFGDVVTDEDGNVVITYNIKIFSILGKTKVQPPVF